MATQEYGSFPGVKARVIGGGIEGVVIGVEQKLLLVGRGDPNNGDANYNEPTEIRTQASANSQFGAGTRLAEGVQKALANGANSEFVYGVMPTEITVNDETIAGGSGTLAYGPVVEDDSTYSAYAVSDAENVNVNIVFESAPPEPASGVNINPLTQEVNGAPDSAGSQQDYQITYNYLDWSTAIDETNRVVNHQETGVLSTLSDANTVAQDVVAKVDEIRPDYKLIRGVVGAQPNATNADGEGIIDTSSYVNQIDNDAVFAAGPVRRQGAGSRTILGGIAGHFAGNELINPVFKDTIRGYDSLVYSLNKTEENELVSSNTIPVRDSSLDGEEGITLQSNVSTSTATDWKRDYHRRRVVDQVLLIARAEGQRAVSQLLSPGVTSKIRSSLRGELLRLVEGRAIQPNPEAEEGDLTQEEKKHYVNVFQSAPDEVSVEIGVTPTGIVKRVDETIVVSDS